MKLFFASLGCSKNLVDSEVMLGILDKQGYELTPNPEGAEIIIINTCAFIGPAKEESVETILEMAEHKKEGSCHTLVVSGCLAQRYFQQLESEFPEVDFFIGTGQYHKVAEIIESKEKRSFVDFPAFIHTEKDDRLITGSKHSAFLKISEGCNRRCSFCIIPKLRGNVRSRSIDSLVIETQHLVKAGVREINLVAQDLTEYGIEWKYRQNLEMLLPRLCKINDLEWIRLHYVYPENFSNELLEIIKTEEKIVNYLDMPIQHTSDRILKLMNRKLTRDKLFTLISRLKDSIPGIAIRTSVIVGFPSETQQEYENLKKDLSELDLDYVGVFFYSKEEGTAAESLSGSVPFATRLKRKKDLERHLSRLAEEKRKSYLGKVFPVMVDGVSEESEFLLEGRLTTQAQGVDGKVYINDLGSLFDSKKTTDSGNILPIKISHALGYDFVGEYFH